VVSTSSTTDGGGSTTEGGGSTTEGGGSTTGIGRAVRTYLDHLSVERGLAANTLTSYRRDLRRYQAHLAECGIEGLDDVTQGTVSGFLMRLREGDAEHPPLSSTSAARTLVAVRGFHKFAVSDGLASDDPARAVKPPTPAKRLPKALPLADVEAILEAAGAPGTTLALRDRALLEVLYGTGARISEAVGLDVHDLDPVDGTVLLRGKGSKERIVPVGSYAREAVDAYLVRGRPELVSTSSTNETRATTGGALFLNARGGRLSRQSAWAVLVKAADRAGVTKDVSPHTLRHSFATHLLDGGADVRVVQELLGHASVTTTQVYTLVTVDNLREVFATAHPRARD
jgi:integrase/recombinase XerD